MHAPQFEEQYFFIWTLIFGIKKYNDLRKLNLKVACCEMFSKCTFLHKSCDIL